MPLFVEVHHHETDIALGVVLTGGCPAGDNLLHRVEVISFVIGKEEAEGGTEPVLHVEEATEDRGTARGRGLALPVAFTAIPDVERVVVLKQIENVV